MTGVSLASWLVVAALVDANARVDVLLWMAGPLLVVNGSWLLAERAYRRRPEGLTPVMIVSFAFKLVFVGAYFAVMIRILTPRLLPFVASFTGYFTGLYLMEALYLRRLFR